MLQHALNRGIITTLALFFALTVFLAGGGFVQISLADEEADQLEAQVKSSADAYNDAVTRQEELAAEIAELDARIAELEAKLPAQRERSDESIRALYKYEYDSSSVLMMLLESTSVTDMLAIVDSYNWIIEYNTAEIQSAIKMENELKSAKQQLETNKADVDKAAQDALSSLQQAREARERMAARAAAAQAAEQQANQYILNSSLASAEEKQAASEANNSASSANASNVGWSSDKSQFVNEWAPRINAYLSGSPMSGTGVAYAAAAWDNGVDPRWAPAISYVESSKGAVCYRSYNAWGLRRLQFRLVGRRHQQGRWCARRLAIRRLPDSRGCCYLLPLQRGSLVQQLCRPNGDDLAADGTSCPADIPLSCSPWKSLSHP